MKDSIRQEIEGKRREFMELSRRIDGLPIGPVRMVLKQKRNAITGQINLLRQMLIKEELKSDNPQHVPKIHLPTKMYTGTLK
jgi:hypothetical protein